MADGVIRTCQYAQRGLLNAQKELCFNIRDRNMREVGGALLVHLPVQRVHHARHTGANGAVPVNVAAVPRAVHKAGIYRLRHLPERKSCGDGAKAIAAVRSIEPPTNLKSSLRGEAAIFRKRHRKRTLFIFPAESFEF